MQNHLSPLMQAHKNAPKAVRVWQKNACRAKARAGSINVLIVRQASPDSW